MLLITSVALVGIVINIVYPSLFTDFFGGKAIVRIGEQKESKASFLNSNYLGFTIAVTFSYASFFLLKSTHNAIMPDIDGSYSGIYDWLTFCIDDGSY